MGGFHRRVTMKLNIFQCGALVAIAMMFFGSSIVPVQAESTLKKMGKAIQYTTRKDAENLSIDTHRALSHKSVEKDRRHDARWVILPNGKKVYKGTNNPTHHRRHHHHPAMTTR